MNELVTRVAENVGIEPATAEKAVGMILGFLQREAADGPVAQMIEAIPGASELIAQYNGEGTGGGGLLGDRTPTETLARAAQPRGETRRRAGLPWCAARPRPIRPVARSGSWCRSIRRTPSFPDRSP